MSNFFYIFQQKTNKIRFSYWSKDPDWDIIRKMSLFDLKGESVTERNEKNSM